jgi:hypothetical protein
MAARDETEDQELTVLAIVAVAGMCADAEVIQVWFGSTSGTSAWGAKHRGRGVARIGKVRLLPAHFTPGLPS